MKSLPKTIESLAVITEKEFGNINDQPLKEIGTMSFALSFSFDIDDMKILVSGYQNGIINIEKFFGKGKKPKKKVQEFRDIDADDFLDLVKIPVIELQQVARGEFFFELGDRKFIIVEEGVGYQSRGLSAVLYVLEDGFKRIKLRDIAWILNDGESGYQRSPAIINEHIADMDMVKSTALTYIFKFLKLNS